MRIKTFKHITSKEAQDMFRRKALIWERVRIKFVGKVSKRGERTLFFAKATYCVFKKGFSPLKKHLSLNHS